VLGVVLMRLSGKAGSLVSNPLGGLVKAQFAKSIKLVVCTVLFGAAIMCLSL
jgi:hypothetical protein